MPAAPPRPARPRLPTQHWLFKTDPREFTIDDLAGRPGQTEPWNGVRNYQVRNWFRDTMRVGDKGLFYNSNCAVPGIVGEIEIVTDGYPDPTQFDKKSRYHDPKASLEAPRWYLVDVKLTRRYPEILTLARVREHADELEGCFLIATGNQRSVFPLSRHHWDVLTGLVNG